MKVRIAENKIRFRLRKHDVADLHEIGIITQVLEFGSGMEDRLAFTLQSSENAEANIQYSMGNTTVLLPVSVAEELNGTDRIGFDFSIDTGKGKLIDVLIEKDFSCLDGSDGDNADTYANPTQQAC
ncbi:MAG: hypothetical protein JWQ28_1709 [Pedobacter sp.]|jgi:hypothetical protein|nr:hypothetical protein [Pedobacter sp.]